MTKDIKKKSMPKIIKLSLFLCLLGIFSGGLLSFVNNITEKMIAYNEEKKEFAEIKKIGIEEESLSRITDFKNEDIKKMYRALTTDKIPCYIFIVEDKNAFTTVKTIIVVESATEKVLKIKVYPGSTSHDKDHLMENSGFGMIGEELSALNEKFEVITGASDSSASVKQCLLTVYNELALMTGKVVFKEINQCLPEINNYKCSFIIDEKEINLLLKYNESSKKFEYISTLSGDVTSDAIDDCLVLATINFPTEYIKSVYSDANGKILTIVTDKGYRGVIIAEIKINNKNKITEFILKESQEDYRKNNKYIEEEDVDYIIFNQYDLGIKNKVVTGATTTSYALNHILWMADNYIASLGGTING